MQLQKGDYQQHYQQTATINNETTLFFEFVDPNDTYVVSDVTFYDDNTSRDFTADKTTDAS